MHKGQQLMCICSVAQSIRTFEEVVGWLPSLGRAGSRAGAHRISTKGDKMSSSCSKSSAELHNSAGPLLRPRSSLVEACTHTTTLQIETVRAPLMACVYDSLHTNGGVPDFRHSENCSADLSCAGARVSCIAPVEGNLGNVYV